MHGDGVEACGEKKSSGGVRQQHVASSIGSIDEPSSAPNATRSEGSALSAMANWAEAAEDGLPDPPTAFWTYQGAPGASGREGSGKRVIRHRPTWKVYGLPLGFFAAGASGWAAALLAAASCSMIPSIPNRTFCGIREAG